MKLVFKTKLVLSILTICLLAFLLLPQITLAGTGVDIVKEGLNTTADIGQIDKTTDLPSMIGVAVNYILGVVGVIFLTVALIGGYMWMTAGGNEEKVGKAKKFIMNGINGIIVIFLAYALVYLILYALNQATINKIG